MIGAHRLRVLSVEKTSFRRPPERRRETHKTCKLWRGLKSQPFGAPHELYQRVRAVVPVIDWFLRAVRGHILPCQRMRFCTRGETVSTGFRLAVQGSKK